MGCSSVREKIENEMMKLELKRAEVQMEREMNVNQLSKMQGKKIKYENIPDYIDPKFALEKRIYKGRFIHQVEEISKETNKSIGVILIHIGWLMKEGKLDENWNFYVKRTMTQINIEFVGSSAGDVYQVLSITPFPISIEDIVKKALLNSSTTIEGALLGIGWLFKEGKLYLENNLIGLA